EHDWRPRRCRGAQGPVSGANENTAASATPAGARSACARTTSYCGPASTAGSRAGSCGSAASATARTGACPTTATTTSGGGCRNSHPSDVALAHGCVPGGLDLAGIVNCDGVVCVVDEDVGIGNTVNRAVQVVEHRSLVAPVAVIVVAPLKLHRRE